jgi:hypothetical protein
MERSLTTIGVPWIHHSSAAHPTTSFFCTTRLRTRYGQPIPSMVLDKVQPARNSFRYWCAPTLQHQRHLLHVQFPIQLQFHRRHKSQSEQFMLQLQNRGTHIDDARAGQLSAARCTRHPLEHELQHSGFIFHSS